MNRVEIINELIKRFNYNSYLEIGVQNGLCFNAIKVSDKVGVDPDAKVFVEYKMTSDDFFLNNKKTFDIIFIDGLHEAEQVYKDIINSLNCLNPNGTIVCHDMNPKTELAQKVPRESKVWNGDCWKAFFMIKKQYPNLEAFTIDTDHGCGIIRNNTNIVDFEYRDNIVKHYIKQPYSFLVKYRFELLELISIKQFKQYLITNQ